MNSPKITQPHASGQEAHTALACNAHAANERKIAGLVALAQHVLDMADDAYLIGHPEWSDAIVPEARAGLALAQANEAQP